MRAFDLEQVSVLVAEKGWSIFDGILRNRGETVEKILADFLNGMTFKERSLVLKLLSDYLILKDYTRPSLELLDQICSALNEPTIRFAPVKVHGASRIKSGDALVYEMDANQGMIEGKNLIFRDDPAQPEFWDNEDAKVVVDDFVGTGDQFLGMLADLKEKGIEPNINMLATLVIQQSGKDKIEAAGIRVISLHVRPKALEKIALEQNVDIQEIEEFYLTIESGTLCSPFESMGYMASQALVTMKKTPDNTLPIFWLGGENKWPAPFPRKLK